MNERSSVDLACGWPVRILIALLTIIAFGNAYAAPAFFGYYNYYWAPEYPYNDAGVPLDRYLDLDATSPYANVVMLDVSHDDKLGQRLALLKARNLKAGIMLDNTFFDTLCTTSLADLSRWDALRSQIGANGDAIAFFYFEEPYWSVAYNLSDGRCTGTLADGFRRTYGLLTEAGRKLKDPTNGYPTVPILMMESYPAHIGAFGVPCDSLGSNCLSLLRAPQSFDWIGLEGFYPQTVDQFNGVSPLPGGSMVSASNYVAAVLDTIQRSGNTQLLALAYPVAVKSTETAADYQAQAAVIDKFTALARSQSKFVAALGYHSRHESYRNDTDGVSLFYQAQQTLRAKMPGVGYCIRSGFAASACVPSAPTIVGVVSGVESVTLSFTGGAEGGSATTSYSAACGSGAAITGASPLTVAGLLGGNTYSCMVTATNSFGASSAAVAVTPLRPPSVSTGYFRDSGGSIYYSNGSYHYCSYTSWYQYLASGGPANTSGQTIYSLVPYYMINDGKCSTPDPTVPSAPAIGAVSTTGSTSVTVNFSAPSSNGGLNITGYRVYANGAAVQDVTGSPTGITGLTTGASYTFKVAAINPVGVGVQSGASNVVTPQASVPQGYFRDSGGTIYYSNGSFHTCAYTSWARYLASGGNPDTSGMVVYSTYPSSFMTNDGACP